MKDIEVEIRSFISEEKYLELLDFFNKEQNLKKRMSRRRITLILSKI